MTALEFVGRFPSHFDLGSDENDGAKMSNPTPQWAFVQGRWNVTGVPPANIKQNNRSPETTTQRTADARARPPPAPTVLERRPHGRRRAPRCRCPRWWSPSRPGRRGGWRGFSCRTATMSPPRLCCATTRANLNGVRLWGGQVALVTHPFGSRITLHGPIAFAGLSGALFASWWPSAAFGIFWPFCIAFGHFCPSWSLLATFDHRRNRSNTLHPL